MCRHLWKWSIQLHNAVRATGHRHHILVPRALFPPPSDEKSLGNEIAGVTVEVSNDVPWSLRTVFRTLKPVLCPPNLIVIVTYVACDPIITIITITVESIYSITAISIPRAVVVEAIIDICNEEKCSQYNKYAQYLKRYTLQLITLHIYMKEK